jgi:glutathione-regulated potassium-efflux system ancillary protein KefF
VILVVHAHPYAGHSRAGGALLATIRDLPDLEVRSIYELYPDFDIDATAERQALERASLVVLLHPLYWYTTPALLKHWFDVVLVKGWAYGEGGTALKGKDCLWVTTTGGDEEAFSAQGKHAHGIEAFSPVVEQTMRFCGLRWLEPFVVYAGHQITDEVLRAAAARLRQRLQEHAR